MSIQVYSERTGLKIWSDGRSPILFSKVSFAEVNDDETVAIGVVIGQAIARILKKHKIAFPLLDLEACTVTGPDQWRQLLRESLRHQKSVGFISIVVPSSSAAYKTFIDVLKSSDAHNIQLSNSFFNSLGQINRFLEKNGPNRQPSTIL